MKVTYKDRLSRGESSTNAAWAPIEKTAVPGPTPGSAPIQKTVTCDKGIRFIPHPPDLRREPPREDWVEDNVKKVAQHCRKIHQIRYETDLSVTEKREWYVLGCMLSSSPHSSALPSMPHTAQATGTATTAGFLPSGESAMLKLDGTPRPLLPILETLMRFERPLITWNVFKEAPPTAFTSVFTPHTRDDGMQASNQEEQVEAPRDPRRVNNVVHKDFSQSEWRRGRASLSVEEWLDSTPPRLEREDLGDGRLFIVKLNEADGQFRLGLVQLEIDDTSGALTGWWFARKSKSHAWPAQHVPFERYPPHGPWVSDPLDVEAVLLAVEDSDLTETGAKEKNVNPVLNNDFMQRLRAFAEKYDLTHKKETRKQTGPAPAPAQAPASAPTQAPAQATTAPTRPSRGGRKRKASN